MLSWLFKVTGVGRKNDRYELLPLLKESENNRDALIRRHPEDGLKGVQSTKVFCKYSDETVYDVRVHEQSSAKGALETARRKNKTPVQKTPITPILRNMDDSRHRGGDGGEQVNGIGSRLRRRVKITWRPNESNR